MTAFEGAEPVWQAAVLFRGQVGPFASVALWAEAGVVLVGGSEEVLVLSASSGVMLHELDLKDGYFGAFVVAPDSESVFVLGATRVIKLDRNFSEQWRSPDIALGGVVSVEFRGDHLILDCERNPPGGWVRVELEMESGLARSST